MYRVIYVEPMSELLKGPTAVMWSNESPVAPAKIATKVKVADAKSIDRVEFLVGDEVIFVDREPPYECTHDFGENSKEISIEYGNISKASVGAIQRRLLVLEEQGGKQFLGEPALDIARRGRRISRQ